MNILGVLAPAPSRLEALVGMVFLIKQYDVSEGADGEAVLGD